MNTILTILVLLAVAAIVYYFVFYKQGKINDRDGDFIPDELEDAVEDLKDVVDEAKRRAKTVKEEVKDVVEEAKDVVDAVKGKSRKGRKPQVKNSQDSKTAPKKRTRRSPKKNNNQ